MSGFKNNILVLTTEFPPGPGGIGNHGYNLSRFLNMAGFQMTVITSSDFTDEESERIFDSQQNFRIVRFKRYNNRIKTYRKRIKIISDEVKKNDFTHIIFSGRFSLYASLFLKKNKKDIKFIAIAHGGDINAVNTAEKYFVRKALSSMDLIIPVSKYSASKLPVGKDTSKIRVIPNGFDFDNAGELNIKKREVLTRDPVLVTVGTIWPRKGHHNVLNSLNQILQMYPDAKYNIAGRQADTSEIDKYLKDECLKKHINIFGQVTNKKLHEILDESDIFIMLSESQSSGDFEGFGIAVIEANYFGLPAIGSLNSGLEDAISDGVSGILVNPGNPEEVTQAVKMIKEDYEGFSFRARDWAEKHHWSKIVKIYSEAINQLN
ncbi:MAG: glycosyltransferase family 4 protein [Ignavibacteria bacterium]|nr:glycosyltransferase family 4 protein [Ignavibacteria bacterium]